MAVAARQSGGIRTCLEEQVSLQRQAVRGVLKCLYWLAKEETAHHTKFRSLLELAKSLISVLMSMSWSLPEMPTTHYIA